MKRLRFEMGSIDDVDARILAALAANSRLSLAELSRQIGISSPSVSERIKRLEEAGVITGYSVTIDPAALGRAMAVWLRIRPVPGQLSRVAALVADIPEIVECDRITGDDCFLARAHVRTAVELEKLLDRINPYAATNTSLVQSSPVKRRLPPLGNE